MGNITIQGDLTGGIPGGAVGGGNNLTTVGAIPYVSASGVLGQVSGFTLTPTGGGGRVIETGSDGTTVANIRGGSGTTALRFGASTSYSFAIVSSGNHLFGTTPSSDGGYKLDVQTSGSTGTLRVYDQTATTGSTKAVVRAGAGQSGNLQEWQNNAGTVLGYVNSSGQFAQLAGGAIKSVYYTSTALASDSSVRFNSTTDLAGGSVDLALYRNAAGVLEINNGTAGTYRDLYTRSQILYGAGTGVKTLQVRGNSSNDAIIQEWQNNAGTTLASISSAGVAAFAGVSAGSLSTTGSALVGAAGLYYWTGRSVMSSSSDGIIAFTNNAGTNFDRLIFGVGNSSFPSLKRSGSVLEVRLADDSAYAALQAVRLQTAAQTVSQLPAAAAGNAGSIQYVTDANATTIGSTVAGGGANKVMVWSDGTNWKIYAS